MAFLSSALSYPNFRPRKLRARMAAALFLWIGIHGSGQPVSENQVKAVFLLNFAQFVEWPPAAFTDPAAPVVIGILGTDPFGSSLDEAVGGETARGRTLVARRFRRLEEIDTCHILFIGRSESHHLERIVSTLRDRHVLTVSDAEGFARRGVMIRFFMENKRLRLRIDLQATRAAGLVLSSKLLRPAEIVDSSKEDGT